ncbi:GMC oxidoreductase-domain-containing protein [Xylariomycetidae sp. FL2044]|nr:GMC oxidoreductase-domain-containing protein [Xylariomycetidae sp. FL2044]
MSSDTYDIAIVGGGTSGLVLASRLSEDPNLRVVVLETGSDRSTDQNTLVPGAWPLLTNSPNDWSFPTAPQEHIKRSITIPQGKCLGGSSAINSFIFALPSRATVEGWHKLGNEGWDYASYEKALTKSFTLHHKSSGATEGQGPLQLTLAEPQGLWEKAWIEGMESVGFSRTDPLSGNLGGPHLAAESIDPRTKQRSYAANAYLDPARERSNLTVLTETTVLKVLFESAAASSDESADPARGDQAVAKGVQFLSPDGSIQTLEVRKEVIIAAGVINSPRLLELSGIGGADLLRPLGIDDVVADNPHVGENLQNHLFTGIAFEAQDDVDTLDAYFRQEPDALQAAMRDYAARAGPMSTSNLTMMGQFPLPEFHTEEGRQELDKLLLRQDDPQPEPRSSSTATPSFAAAHEAFVRSVLEDPAGAVGNYVFGAGYAPFDGPSPTYRARPASTSPSSSSSRTRCPGAPCTSPPPPLRRRAAQGRRAWTTACSIDYPYLSHPLDLEILARQLRFIEDLITRAEPIARHLKTKPYGKRFVDLDAARENLRVCDASVVPLEPTANPQAVVYAVAEMGARFVREDVRG